MRGLVRNLLALCWAAVVATGTPGTDRADPTDYGRVDAQRLRDADREPQQWFSVGRDVKGAYYSPLADINDRNVGGLGFAWEYRTGTDRGLEATPVVIDGIMYTSGNWGVAIALDAATGKLLWRFDPHNDGQAGRYACCDVVNRGVAVWQGKVYVASTDGRLFALDARTGAKLWEADTIVDHKLPYTITGAPQIAKDVVVIGNGGADIGTEGVRGYISAFDLATGRLKWRFFTVPSRTDTAPAGKAALDTWDPKAEPRGGTVWNNMSYDPDLNLIYFGTGNASPYTAYDRNPSGLNGDDLYAASIVALDADTGRLAWYFQTTPSDNWDYDATSPLVQAEIPIDGMPRKTIMQASKNGYFYLLDRATGTPLSANAYSYLNWSKGLDGHFRPIASDAADYTKGPKLVYPSMYGAHDWAPMSYDSQTGLVYIPAIEAPVILVDLQRSQGALPEIDGSFRVGNFIPDKTYTLGDSDAITGKLKLSVSQVQEIRRSLVRGVLKAWDPVGQKLVWEHQTSRDYFTFDGGVMSSAGNLVFQGRPDGALVVYAADTGKVLKTIETGSAMMAAPMTYEIDGVQYVAIMAGYGGALISFPIPPSVAAFKYRNEGRILVFRLGGAPDVPKPALRNDPPFRQPPQQASARPEVERGFRLFTKNCSRCHVFGPGITPDLRRLDDGIDDVGFFKQIVREGALAPMGMGRFDDVISDADADAIHAYLVDEATKAFSEQEKRKKLQ